MSPRDDEIFDRSPLLRRAYEVARAAHDGNTRKGSDLPEFSHPEAVARIVDAHGFSEVQIAAALLHDVIEDTLLEPPDLEGSFPADVLAIVHDLTESPEVGSPGETWLTRKQQKLARLGEAGVDSLAVCAADRLHNLQTLAEMAEQLGPETWHVFSRGPEETLWFEREVLSTLTARFDHPILDEYRAALDRLARIVAAFPPT